MAKRKKLDSYQKFERRKTTESKVRFIEQKMKEYKAYQEDDTVDAGPAFAMADLCSHTFMPWLIQHVHLLRGVAMARDDAPAKSKRRKK